MRRLALLLLLTGCTAPVETPQSERNTHVYNVTADAYRDVLGQIPEHCRTAWRSVAVSEVSPDEIESACGDLKADQDYPDWAVVTGCLRGNVILLSDDQDELALADSLAHEYVHLLARECDGDLDAEHARPELWDPPDGVWWQALAAL